MSAKMFAKFASTVVAVILLFGTSNNAESGVTATITGSVISKQIIYGSAGSISEILLIVNTWDGNYWGIQCTRAESNLGKCYPIESGNSISAEGSLVCGGFVGYGNLSPSTVDIL